MRTKWWRYLVEVLLSAGPTPSSFFFLSIIFPSKCIKGAFHYGPVPKQDQESVPKQDQESVPKQDQEYLSAPSLDCLCKAGASSWSCSINPNRTRNLSMLLCGLSLPDRPHSLVSYFSLSQDHYCIPASLYNHVPRSCWGPTGYKGSVKYTPLIRN